MNRVRYMRLLVFFDLPVTTSAHRKNYRLFRKYLEKSGFIMMQASVYSKLALNDRIADGVIASIRAHRPPAGLVQVLKITERQYETIATIVGESRNSEILESTDGLVIL